VPVSRQTWAEVLTNWCRHGSPGDKARVNRVVTVILPRLLLSFAASGAYQITRCCIQKLCTNSGE
jgi:hypothetical protein